jgi:hypothetical protein
VATELPPASTSLGRAMRAAGGPAARSTASVLGEEGAPRDVGAVTPSAIVRKGA